MNVAVTGAEQAHAISPVYYLHEGELILDASVEEAWPHVINYPSWQNYSIVRHVSGAPGAEGEVVLLKKEEVGDCPPYYARTITVDPPRRIIWKTFPPEGSDYFGIVDFRLSDAQGKTRFTFSMLYEFVRAFQSDSEVAEFRRQQDAGVEAMLASVLPKLKSRIENRS